MVFKTDYHLMQVKGSNANSLTFIKLPVVIKNFVLSIFEWPFYTGFTVIETLLSYFNETVLLSIQKYMFK